MLRIIYYLTPSLLHNCTNYTLRILKPCVSWVDNRIVFLISYVSLVQRYYYVVYQSLLKDLR